MKRSVLTALILTCTWTMMSAVEDNTVEIVYDGNNAKVTIADNISSYVTVSSGTSSHVVLTQAENFAGVDANADNEDGEIIYILSGSSPDGEFYMEGAFKCTVELKGITLNNPQGPAINIQNGKRVSISAQKSTTNTLTDGVNEDYNGCFHCKGHTKFKGKGTLNVVGNSRHAIYSKEYIEIKNITINVTSAQKDAIHCKEYFLIESGSINITGAGDDGIQVEQDTKSTITGQTASHEEENSGNFYQSGGAINISGYAGKAVKADGDIILKGGTRNFTTADTEAAAAVASINADRPSTTTVYNLQGRQVSSLSKGLYIFKNGTTTTKVIKK